MSKSDPHVFMWMPLPPPFAGPEVASALLAGACKRHLTHITIENATLRASNMTKGRLDWSGIAAFARAYPRFVRGVVRSDVVYLVAAANGVGSARDAVLAATARVLGKHVVFHLRGARYGDYYNESQPPMRWLLRASWGSARRAIVQTPGLRNVLARAAPDVEMCVLPNGLPAGEFQAKQDYATEAPRILFVGHLTYPKGFYHLMIAFREVRRRHPLATLVCAGERPRPERSIAGFLPPPLRAEYLEQRETICREIDDFIASGEGVEYKGVVQGEAKRELFESADVLVLPSFTEGFSMAVLEAMFYGLSIIASRAGGLPDVVRDGVNGLLVDAGDSQQLGVALDRLLGDAAMREQMGRRNAEEARKRYDLDVVAAQLAAILRGTTATQSDSR